MPVLTADPSSAIRPMLPWFQWMTIPIGPLTIQVWGLFVALGMAVSFFVLRARAEAGKRQQLLDLALWLVVSGFLFARIFHVVFYSFNFYLSHPADIFKVWEGGLSSFGGLFGAAVAFVWYCQRRGIGRQQWLGTADHLSFAAVYGWMIGRLGCLMIHDHLGRPCNCFLAVQMPDGMPRLEMALLEIIGIMPLAILFFLYRKKMRSVGWWTSVLFIYYGSLRFVLDFFRATDIPAADVRYFGLTPGQYFAIILVLLGSSFFLKQFKKSGRIA